MAKIYRVTYAETGRGPAGTIRIRWMDPRSYHIETGKTYQDAAAVDWQQTFYPRNGGMIDCLITDSKCEAMSFVCNWLKATKYEARVCDSAGLFGGHAGICEETH